jgi:hypothetical protein
VVTTIGPAAGFGVCTAGSAGLSDDQDPGPDTSVFLTTSLVSGISISPTAQDRRFFDEGLNAFAIMNNRRIVSGIVGRRAKETHA